MTTTDILCEPVVDVYRRSVMEGIGWWVVPALPYSYAPSQDLWDTLIYSISSNTYITPPPSCTGSRHEPFPFPFPRSPEAKNMLDRWHQQNTPPSIHPSIHHHFRFKTWSFNHVLLMPVDSFMTPSLPMAFRRE